MIINIQNNINLKVFKIAYSLKNDLPEITIIHERNAYSAKVTKNEIKKFANLLELDPEIYLQNLISYITKQATEINIDIVDKEFIIFKHNKIRYYSTNVKKVDYTNTIENLLELITTRNDSLQKEITQFEQEKEQNLNEVSLYKNKWKEIINLMEQRENHLYSCFMQLLNEKKKYIQHLSNTQLPESKRRKLNAEKIETYEGISDSDTNDSLEDKMQQEDVKEPSPGTSNLNLQLLEDDDDDDFGCLKPLAPRVNESTSTVKVENIVSLPPIENNTNNEESEKLLPKSQFISYSTQDILDSF